MKTTLLLALLSIFTQCQSQKIDKIMIPTVDSKFEKFEQKMDQSRIDIVNDNEHIIYTSANAGFGEGKYEKNSYFSLIKNFYPTKHIASKGITFNEGSPIGIWYYYDEKGNLIKEENTDQGYDFGPKDIINYCAKNNIKLPKGYQETGFRTKVLKEVFQGKKIWEISYQIAADQIEQITLNGKTGREISKKIVPFLNN